MLGFDLQLPSSPLKLILAPPSKPIPRAVVHVVGRIVARLDVIAQATQPRLGVTCRNRSELALELSLRRRALVLSETPSRSGDRGSPKRGRVGA
ncbi:hypothetical protein DEO72_LG6g835 [Vigna unguiculata]|uniref:Uncharacterized protein n=1 Tax=Vigna unguiculata TaxID=3917 RepID=A0A4D6M5V4_VIGUN|nr:hypothetical protein DEO72_LG6g835 [Vigna unguiculata]